MPDSDVTPGPVAPAAADAAAPGLKLNLGCGQYTKPGWVNVDKFGSPDVQHDLEQFPWPWGDSSASEVELLHVLEHLGATPDKFIGVMKELYRVCRDGATILIHVPHPRCDDFINDPTHVRAITPEMLTLFSKKMNLEWKRLGASNSPLALYHDVDFELANVDYELTADWSKRLQMGVVKQDQLQEFMRTYNNVVRQTKITLRVVKPMAS